MDELDRIARGLVSAFPDLDSVWPLRLLAEGFSSTAVETSAGIVFRIARSEAAGACYEKEALNLPLLQPHLPVAIPEPYWYTPSSRDFPHGVIGYPKLSGTPLEPDDLQTMDEARAVASQIGEVMAALHRIPHHEVRLEDDTEQQALWTAQRDLVLPALQDALLPDEYQAVLDWWDDFLADEGMTYYTPVVRHGDLWYGNMLFEGQRMVGLLDFEALALGDPAQDFVPQLYLGETFLDLVVDAYQGAGGALDADFRHRLRQWFAVREFGGLQWSIEHDDAEEFADSIMKIRRGPILHPSGLDGWSRDYGTR